jgi:hypothetical protein
MDNICNPELYMVYGNTKTTTPLTQIKNSIIILEYPPPEMKEGCIGFLMVN